MRFLGNRAFEREIRQQAEHREGLLWMADRVRRAAEAKAKAVGGPWVPRKGHPQPIEVGEDADGIYVANTDHAGHLMEYGGPRTPPYAPLRQGARSAGLRVDEHQ